MLKRLARFILKDEFFTEECVLAINERFCKIEDEQYLLKSLINRNDSLMRKLRADMKILQTRQVDILNRMQRLKNSDSQG